MERTESGKRDERRGYGCGMGRMRAAPGELATLRVRVDLDFRLETIVFPEEVWFSFVVQKFTVDGILPPGYAVPFHVAGHCAVDIFLSRDQVVVLTARNTSDGEAWFSAGMYGTIAGPAARPPQFGPHDLVVEVDRESVRRSGIIGVPWVRVRAIRSVGGSMLVEMDGGEFVVHAGQWRPVRAGQRPGDVGAYGEDLPPGIVVSRCCVCSRDTGEEPIVLRRDLYACSLHSWAEIVRSHAVEGILRAAERDYYRDRMRNPAQLVWGSSSVLGPRLAASPGEDLRLPDGVRVLVVPSDVSPQVFACDEEMAGVLLARYALPAREGGESRE